MAKPSGLVISLGGKPSGEASEDGDEMDAKAVAMKAFIKAVKADDAEGAAEVFKDLYTLCASGSEGYEDEE